MKLNKIFAALMLVMAVAFAACADKNPPSNPDNSGNDKPEVPTDSTQVPTDTTQVPTDTTSNVGTIDYLEGEISVAQALEQAANLAGGDTIFGFREVLVVPPGEPVF
jgi:PBP1b-binding outer membrane lipoprotein LpoB